MSTRVLPHVDILTYCTSNLDVALSITNC